MSYCNLSCCNFHITYNFYREEKTEALLECKEELEHNKALLVKLRQEVIYIQIIYILIVNI